MITQIRRRAHIQLRRWIHWIRAIQASTVEKRAKEKPRKQGPSKKVVVVGAGLAGLSAAYHLTKLGHEVTLLEAREVPGGRVLTLRRPFADGLHADAGGFRFRDDHDWVLKFVKLFDLATDPFYPKKGEMLVCIGDARVRRKLGSRIIDTQFSRPLLREARWVLEQESEGQWFRFRDGADVLPKALASKLENRIQYGAAVHKIEHDSQKVQVGFIKRRTPQTLTADHLICTVPFSTLRGIEFFPPLSPAKQQVIQELPYTPTTIVFLQLRKKFWEAEGLNGFAIRDDQTVIWHPTFDRKGERGILIYYVKSALALRVGAMEENARIRLALEQLEGIFPGIHNYFELGLSKCWDEDVWAQGAQSRVWDMPNRLCFEIARPAGKIHFAGEHAASAWPGWMEGALESGYRVAQEVGASP